MKAQSQWALPGETIRYTVEASQYAREQIKGSIPASVAFSVDPAAGKWAVGTCVLPIGKTKIAFPVLMPTADKVSAGFTFNEQCRPEVRLSNKEREPILAHIRIAAGEQVQEVHEEIPPAGSDKATRDYRPENPEKGVEVKATVEVDKRQWSFGRKLYFASVHRGKITIDGNTDDWASLPRISLREWYKLTSDKPNGFSADMSLAYDDKAFYALVEVKDRAHFQRFSPSESWRGDSVQIAFDTEPVGEHHPIEMTFGLTDSGEPIFYSPMMNENLDGITGKVVRRSGKTVYEMRFPMSALHGVQAKPGSRLGFSLLVNDNDTGAREGWLCWSGGIGDRKDAELYGQLLLAE